MSSPVEIPNITPYPSTDITNNKRNWHEKPLGKVILDIIIIVLATFVLYLITQYTDLLSPIVEKP
ncbi:hypothetical protein LCGC14_1676470 [marine sediment metagenome]|uniref:Uncharacterized protein n=1 Tax=marine sediment metagenome TaxID=412755 RepID=A0A0F9HPY0_9ZZZZ